MTLRLISVCIALLASTSTLNAGILSFSGKVYEEGGAAPLANALVVAGVFKNGFDPLNYTNFYGDNAGNLLPGAYDQAVADGNFKVATTGLGGPPAAVSDANGNFTWFGNPAVWTGEHLWFFVFPNGDKSAAKQVLATSSASHWIAPLPSGANTTIVASEADTFVMGQRFGDGVAVTIAPMPEPAAAIMGFIAFGCLGFSRRASRL